MNEPNKPKSTWRMARRALISLAVIATLIALFYTEEDWRGKQDWQNYRRAWELKGEKFDWQAFAPSNVPANENFFTSSIFTNLMTGKVYMGVTRPDGSFPNLPWTASWAEGKMTDLEAWQDYYRHSTNQFQFAEEKQTPAAGVAQALSKYNAILQEVQDASTLPYSNIPLDYEKGFGEVTALLPYLVELKRCSYVLELQACAELAGGRNPKAFDDVLLLFRLNRSLRTQPFLISDLVRMAILSLTIQPVWEGIAEHAWTDQQLKALETELGQFNYLTDYEFAIRSERDFAIQRLENERMTRAFSDVVQADGTNKVVTMHRHLLPDAFFYQNELAFARLTQEWLLPLVNTNLQIVSPAASERADRAIQSKIQHYDPYRIEALRAFPAVNACVRRFAYAQASVDLAGVACALERYRLAHGDYPESLDALSPQFIQTIPHDIINGAPFHYRRTGGGKYLLYSVGWNGTDDGGVLPSKASGLFKNCDWVWPN